jgi:hypothetical protein
MTEVTLDIEWDPVRVIPVPVSAADFQLIAGPAKLCGWSLRDAQAEIFRENTGILLSPGAGATIVTRTALPAGTYTISWTVGLEGTVAAVDADNFQLQVSGAASVTSINLAVVGQYPQQSAVFIVPANTTVKIIAVAAGTVGATYEASFSIQPASVDDTVVEIQDGNNVLAESGMIAGGTDTHWFGGDGLKARNEVFLHIVSGSVTGAVYARFQKTTG